MKNEFGIYETLRNISSTGNYKPQPILNKRDNNFARLLFAITRNKAFKKNNIGMVGIKFIIKCRKKGRQLELLEKCAGLVEMYLNN